MRIFIVLCVMLNMPFISYANEIITKAELRLKIKPDYPSTCYRDAIEGWVELKYDINKNGDVINITVLNAVPERLFNRSAKKALAKWKYSPKMVNDKAVISIGLITKIDFKLGG